MKGWDCEVRCVIQQTSCMTMEIFPLLYISDGVIACVSLM